MSNMSCGVFPCHKKGFTANCKESSILVFSTVFKLDKSGKVCLEFCICYTMKRDHITPDLGTLYWLPYLSELILLKVTLLKGLGPATALCPFYCWVAKITPKMRTGDAPSFSANILLDDISDLNI